ncbi:unnamed protein product [Urochloa decumbens]|uniref:Uncharacterized protein n=1 Tax=Urochloa decumbens TaxID=240449 RepID=A0ABC9AU89_9POAL
MAGRGRGRCRGGGKARRGHGIRAVLARMRGLVKLGSSCGVGKLGGGGKKLCTCGGRIEGRGGQIEGRRGRIEGPGRRIGRDGFHIDSQGQLYAPDSEDEGVDVEVEDVVVEGGNVVELVADGAPVEELAADGALIVEPAAVDRALIVEPSAVDRALYEEFASEVQARLKVVLAGMDPLYHAVFVDMYKVMVPAFFESD